MSVILELKEILFKEGQEGVIVSTDELTQWNDNIESFLFAEEKSRTGEIDAKDADETPRELLDEMAVQLKANILKLLACMLDIDNESVDHLQQSLAEFVRENSGNLPEKFSGKDDNNFRRLECFIRASSNFFRWYLQSYLENLPLTYPLCSEPFQSSEILTIILAVIEANAKIIDEEPPQDDQGKLSPSQSFARNCSLLLFYITFSPKAPNDEAMQKTHGYLVLELKFISRVLKILTYETQTSAALALSLIRNIHNLMVSFQGAVPTVKRTFLTYDESTAKAPWNPKRDDNTDGLITYPSIFRDILIWSLNTPELPPFPGSKDDRRADLVVEILRIIFAMGGDDVARALRYPSPNISLSELVVTALQEMDIKDPRCRQVQLSTVTILMDANPSFATFLLERDAVKSLFQITEQQIDAILDVTPVDSAAMAALVPSLAVLYKFAAGNPDFWDVAKETVFPASHEAYFQDMVEQQRQNDSDSADGSEGATSAKNMHPLDAPKGTLRWKLIRLMTSPDSHIKRYAGEFLWALCEQDSKEFVYRTGLGNAMAFLAAKGMAQVPTNAFK